MKFERTETDSSGIVFVISNNSGLPHRRPIEPGRYIGASTFVATDISGELPEVQAACQAAWSTEVLDAWDAAHPWVEPPPPEPPVLQPYQFFAMLEISGKKAALDAFINALPPPQNIVARAKLDRSLAFHRDNDLVLAAQQALGLSDAQLDQLWQQASQII